MERGVLSKMGDTPTQSASDEEVRKFERDHSGGPVSGQTVNMHWKSSFMSNWNQQAIFVLASAFLQEHTDCSTPLADLQVLFRRKLERTRKTWNDKQMMQTEDVSRHRGEVAKKNRRKGRLLGVHLIIHEFC
jgi:hypothetical protein